MQVINSYIDNQLLLTIAIPTYNRSEYLALNLRRIYEEVMTLNGSQRALVKVYVADNASTDNSEHIMSQHPIKDLVKFEVANNKENIGAERNVAQCYNVATTPYIWVLGDDDVILSGGLKKVLDILHDQKTDILYVGNYHFLDSYLDTKYALKSKKQGVSTYSDQLKFARRTNVMLTFVSALIVRNRSQVDYDPTLAIGTNLPQLGWVLPLLRDGSRFNVIEDWIVAAKGGNSGGYGLIQVFGENLQEMTSIIFKNKINLANVIQNGTIVNFFPSFILELRSGSSSFVDTNITLGLKRVYNRNWRYYIFLLPLIKLPVVLASRYNSGLNVLRRLFGAWLI